jgi:hypothetical protein
LEPRRTTKREFWSELPDKLRQLASALQQKTAPAIVSLLPNEARAKFCFEQWQSGKGYKEINAALKRHPEWEHFEDDKSVRGPIIAWAKRIDVKPRRGQPGRRARSAR